jgi:ABC-type nickel/cobalt efflux system permease component RcnA
MRRLVLFALALALPSSAAPGHDIPNARVDRSIQATVRPGRLALDYEVSLAELTLTQDLRALIGTLPGADRAEWFDRYGREVGPLIAKGLIVTVDGRRLAPVFRGFDWAVEEHPRYTFHCETKGLSPAGRLAIRDTNFVASEGTSRLGVRGRDGVTLRGDTLSADVELIPIRPLWQLTDAEEQRTKFVEVDYRGPPSTLSATTDGRHATLRALPASGPTTPRARLSRLLDRAAGLSLMTLGLIAFGLGAAHAIQPGHGKTLVAATVLGERGSWLKGAALAIVTTLTHTGSVLAVAAVLWFARSASPGMIHVGLARTAGFAIAAIGLWRLGRHLGGFGEHGTDSDGQDASHAPARGIIGLGVAGGLVPCWDAVGLIVLAEALGRLALGIGLLLAFSLGMAAVLTAVGWAAARFRQLAGRRDPGRAWERGFGVSSALVLAAIGIYLMSVV